MKPELDKLRDKFELLSKEWLRYMAIMYEKNKELNEKIKVYEECRRTCPIKSIRRTQVAGGGWEGETDDDLS